MPTPQMVTGNSEGVGVIGNSEGVGVSNTKIFNESMSLNWNFQKKSFVGRYGYFLKQHIKHLCLSSSSFSINPSLHIRGKR